VATVFFGPRKARVSGAVEFRLPRAAALEHVAIGHDALILRVVDAEILGEVRIEPGADFVAEGFLFGGVFEVQFEYSVEVEGS
jgi:hypothetical protein